MPIYSKYWTAVVCPPFFNMKENMNIIYMTYMCGALKVCHP